MRGAQQRRRRSASDAVGSTAAVADQMICCGVSATSSAGEERRDAIVEQQQDEQVHGADGQPPSRAALTANAVVSRTPNTRYDQAQQVRIGVGLLVVLARRALQPAVLDVPSLHICASRRSARFWPMLW